MAENTDDAALSEAEKDVPMEDLEERLVDELLSPDKEAEDRDESMADQNAGAEESVADQNAEAGGEGTKDDKTPEKTEEQKKEEERKKEEEEKKKKEEEERKKREEEEDAASDAEIEAQDERATLPPTGDVKWQWHIELYPIATEDLLLDNFSKLCSTATYSQVVFREPTADVKKGEAHFYAEDVQTAKTLIRTACCKRLAYQRPYIYIYRRKDESSEEFETAVLRLDLLEAAKIRWDRQKRSKGEPATRIVKVSNVPVGTSKDFLSVVFARAYRVKMDTVMSPADAKKAKAAKAAKEKAKAKRKAEAKAAKAAAAAAAKDKEDANEENEADEEEEEEEEDSESEDEDEEMFGKFNGELTIDCCTRASLKGFLLGYRKVAIGGNLLDIKPLAPEEINVQELRKEARKRRWDEAVNGPTWIPVPPKSRFVREEWGPLEGWESERSGHRGRGRGFGGGRGGDRGRGRGFGGDRGGSSYGRGGGMMKTGRQRMEEKLDRRGRGGSRGHDRDSYGRGRGGYGRDRGGYDDHYGYNDGGYGRPRGRYGRPRDPYVEPDLETLHSIVEQNAYELQRQIATLSALRGDFPEDRYRSRYDAYGGGYQGGYSRDAGYWDRAPGGGGRGRDRRGGGGGGGGQYRGKR